MRNPDETLDAIDAAIGGWVGGDRTVGPEAMRWAPAPPDETRDPVHLAPIGTPADRTGEWAQIGWTTHSTVTPTGDAGDRPDRRCASTSPTYRDAPVALTPEQAAVFRRFAEHVRRQHDALRRTFLRMARHLLGVVARAHAATAPVVYGDAYRRHRRTCRACNPAGNPRPLKVDGADYTRRRRSRRRRGR